MAGSDQLGQAVVADLDDALFHEKVGRLEVAVHDAMIVQIGDSLDEPLEPMSHLVEWQPLRILFEDAGQTGAGNVFHDDEAVAGVVALQVMDGQEIRALEVHALADTTALDVEVAEDQLEGDFLA